MDSLVVFPCSRRGGDRDDGPPGAETRATVAVLRQLSPGVLTRDFPGAIRSRNRDGAVQQQDDLSGSFWKWFSHIDISFLGRWQTPGDSAR